MDSYYRPTRAEISLNALRHNIEAFRSLIPADTKLLACVKANAYGHGAVGIAREAERLGIDYLSVAFLDEALQLRYAGIQTPILVLGYTGPEGLALARQHQITLMVFSEDVAEAAAALPEDPEQPLKVHVKVDSGMGRLGLLAGQEAVDFVERMLTLPQVDVEGIFTHFSCADETNKEYTMGQYRGFQATIDELQTRGITLPIIHTGNSATGIDLPELTGNMLRLGISLYGLYPSKEVMKERVALKPILTLRTRLTRVKRLPKDTGISYGKRYMTQQEEECIGTLPVGYADGFSRMMSGKVEVLIRGQRVPVVGTICMDQCMVKLSGLEEQGESLQAGEEVVLIGSQGGERISVEEIADHTGTINYETVCMLTDRIPRIYIRDGVPVEIDNRLL
ncbi:alanine racemase [Paenibacillus guangzhouensis]|uniref:alanine racemase n=1 Tax=Paenibacillus guangzhouensis TaxID=1473112 RepID=UPI0012672B9A|nr:alanine racemase [Paenibacillus guangzhouensis]